MVQLYNCHPFGSQRIVPTKQAPEVFCCGRDSVFVTCAGGCKVEVFTVCQELCQPLCSFNTLGKVLQMHYSEVGDNLVTIEEKNNISSLRTYVNWRCQSTGSSRVSVRMVGLQLDTLPPTAAKDQMEIIEMPLSENPLRLSCCPVRGDLLVGCKSKLVVFSMKFISVHGIPVLDFDRSLVLHVSGIVPTEVYFCANFVSIMSELEVLVFRLTSEYQEALPDISTAIRDVGKLPEKGKKDVPPLTSSHLPECEDFVVFDRPVELYGEECKSCSIVITPESTGLSGDFKTGFHVSYLLYRRFAPDFADGFSVECTRLHSLQLMPMYRRGSCAIADAGNTKKDLLGLFCFFSMPHTGYLYSLLNPVQLISVYQYPERSQQAVLTPQLLHVITRNNLQCFTVRCGAVTAREEDPIDTTMKTCPPVSMDVCTLRMQLFIGLKAIQHFNNYIVILTKADIEEVAEKGRNSKRLSRKAGSIKAKVSSETEPGWNLYIVSTTPTVQLYREMVEYSRRYETVMTQGSIHLLSEAHLLLRSALMNPDLVNLTDKEELETAFRESCALLGDCFSRLDTNKSHLALPYYKMSCLSVSDVIDRVTSKNFPQEYGKGFMFYLKHSLCEELEEQLSEEVALTVLQIFKAAEPQQLPNMLSSPCMVNVCPAKAMGFLEELESVAGSAVISLTKAAMALRMHDLQKYETEMQHHQETHLLYGFLEEPRLLMIRKNKEIIPTEMVFYLRDTSPGLLIAAMVVFHENSKMNLKEVELFFKVLCEKSNDDDDPQLLVDFWETRLSSYPRDSILQDVLFKLTSHYVSRICKPQHVCIESLKSAEDLRNSCSHFGVISPWVSKMVSFGPSSCDKCGDLIKLQSLLCGPSLEIASFLPFLNFIPQDNNSHLSIHLICATRLLNYESSIERLLDRCPEAVTSYAKHEIKDGSQGLWWNKLLPELCSRIRKNGKDNDIFISSLRDTLEMISMELDLQDFLNVLPDDGIAAFFLPYLVNQSEKKLVA
ncbi:PREDICTED: Hermansky-Pudlak syndrome 3 protein-like [Nanorana parkeri]|uniref:Hermansky-Pudlak syndrome 3 protein-like n=1 Tax=Nanorana parkeri TaxID=125878 RepID=UPI0008549549|nr:PREDICTED: Hermansky-Pudlak syndrome 3 protein-like [Nanorana parkeri]